MRIVPMVDAAMWGVAAGDAPASSPGPLLEVQAARRLRIRWHNALPASAFPEVPGKPAAQLPLVTAVVTSADDSATVQNRLGAEGGARFHVQAGLAGGYLVRDPREAELGLPTCAADGEIHLLLADRNVDVDEAGEVRLLHKTTPDTAEFFRPLTLVDGRVWPRLAARPEVLRLRRWPGGLVSASRIVRCSWPHPIHIHQAQFQPLSPSAGVVAVQAGEEPNKVNLYDPSYRRTLLPIVPPPPDQPSTGRHYEPQETGGWKDTIRVDPGEVVSVAVRFDLAGRYVYHCHVLEHKDTEMMRPILVTPVRMAMDMPGM